MTVTHARPGDRLSYPALRRHWPGRVTTCSACSTSRAGGRASWRPTSPWMRRTCCSASSSASGPRRRPRRRRRWIASYQRADGTWANFCGGPGDLSTTVEAYVALRLAGDLRRRAAHGARRRSWIRARAASRRRASSPGSGWPCSASGPGTTCRSCRRSWSTFPAWFPLNVYDWACWARQTIVPLTVVGSLRPVRSLPFGLDESGADTPPAARRPASRLRPRTGPAGTRRSAAWTGCCTWLRAARARAAAGAGGAPRGPAPLRRLDHRPAGAGRLLGRHPAALGLLADRAAPARLRARSPGDPARAGRPGPVHDLGGHARTGRCGGWRPASRRSGTPCWPSIALADAGLPPDHPALTRAAEWLLAEEIPGPGRLAGAPARAGPGRLGLRVRQRRLSRHRRHRGGGARAAPGTLPAGADRAGRPSPGRRPRAALDHRHAVQGRRLGRVRRRQHLHSW